jgi:hypothetical protein
MRHHSCKFIAADTNPKLQSSSNIYWLHRVAFELIGNNFPSHFVILTTTVSYFEYRVEISLRCYVLQAILFRKFA